MRGLIQMEILKWIVYVALAIVIFLAISRGAVWAANLDLSWGALS